MLFICVRGVEGPDPGVTSRTAEFRHTNVRQWPLALEVFFLIQVSDQAALA